MTRDDILRMAREAALANEGGSVEFNNLDGLEHFANLVADTERKHCYDLLDTLIKAEREMCARVCEEHAAAIHGYDKHGYSDAVRARGEE